MSTIFKPKVERPKAVEDKPLTEVQSRGRVGRTILAGNKKQTTTTQRKSILGG